MMQSKTEINEIRIENYQLITQYKLLIKLIENEWATKQLDSYLTKIYIESLIQKYSYKELDFMVYNLESEVKKLSFSQTLFFGTIAILVTLIVTMITIISSLAYSNNIIHEIWAFNEFTRSSVIIILIFMLIFYFYKYYQYIKLQKYIFYLKLALNQP